MTEEKDIHFTKKKVDEGWKSGVESQKGKEKDLQKEKKPQKEPEKKEVPTEKKKEESTTREMPKMNFGIFLSSLGLQVLMHLGLIEHPETNKKEKNLEGARQTIDLLALLKEKTKGNRTPEEDKLLEQLLSDLQMKYVEVSSK